MSTLRISNIEAKSVPASATIDEKVKITNSSGDVLVFLDGKTSGITTVGINTTDGNITFDANSNVLVTGIITATKFVGTIEPTNLTISGDLSIADKIIHSGDTNTAIRFPAADTFSVETNGAERLRIDSDGRVIIANSGNGGTADINADNFVVKNTASNNSCGISILNADNQNTTLYFGNTSDSKHAEVVWSDASNLFLIGTSNAGASIKFRTANQSDAVLINSSGYVGVKRSTPLANLHTTNNELAIGANPTGATAPNATYDGLVVDGEQASLINIRSCATGNISYGRVAFSDDVRSRGYIDYRHRDGAGGVLEYLNIAVAGSERLRIDSSGNVVIGHTSANAKLHIASGTSTAVGDATNPALQIGATSNYRFAIRTTSEQAIIANKNGDDGIAFHTKTGNSGSFGEACRITSVGNLKFPNGKGIDFSATVNGSGFSQELLDDYEEGNFNGADVSGGGLTLSYSNTGRYVKVGRQVYVIFDITYPSNGDSANISRVSTPYNADLPYGGGWIGWTDLGRPCQVHVSGANVYFMDNNSTGTAKHLYNSELSGKRIIGGYMLMTNS